MGKSEIERLREIEAKREQRNRAYYAREREREKDMIRRARAEREANPGLDVDDWQLIGLGAIYLVAFLMFILSAWA